MKTLELDQMENVEGGSSNTAGAVCTIGTMAWALGALTVETGLGLVLWAIGGAASLYCEAQIAK